VVLPSGLVVPPLPHLVVLAAGLVVVGVSLHRRRPPVTDTTALALVPWMVAGAALRIAELAGAVPAVAAPLATAPAVYGTTAVLAGVAWLSLPGSPRRLAAVGGGVAALIVALAVWTASVGGWWPAVALPIAAVLAVVTVAGYQRVATRLPSDRVLAGVVVFGHALDGVSTALGVDIRCAGAVAACERTPLPRLVMEAAAQLPTAEVIGVGWAFVAVKVMIAIGIVHLARGTVRERPAEGRLLLCGVAALGLGPGVYNVLLFLLTG
jgi:uncharacterized membrane protein